MYLPLVSGFDTFYITGLLIGFESLTLATNSHSSFHGYVETNTVTRPPVHGRMKKKTMGSFTKFQKFNKNLMFV